MQRDLRSGWRQLVIPHSQYQLQPQHHWQSRRNQEQVIELTVKKRRGNPGLKAPAIDRVGDRRNPKEGVPQEAETRHRSAHSTNPDAMANTSLITITIPKPYRSTRDSQTNPQQAKSGIACRAPPDGLG